MWQAEQDRLTRTLASQDDAVSDLKCQLQTSQVSNTRYRTSACSFAPVAKFTSPNKRNFAEHLSYLHAMHCCASLVIPGSAAQTLQPIPLLSMAPNPDVLQNVKVSCIPNYSGAVDLCHVIL